MMPRLIYSADSHIIEPPDLWTSRMDKRLVDRGPRVVSTEETDMWVVGDDRRMAVVGIQFQAGLRYVDPTQITKRGRYADLPELTPDRYVTALGEDGVSGAVLYPSNAHQAYLQISGDVLAEIARVYNDWIIEYSMTHAKQLKPIVMLFIDDVDIGVRELERCKKLGAAGGLIPMLPVPGRRYDEARYEPLWRAAESLDIPLVMHVGGNQGVLDRVPVLDLVRHATKERHVMSSLAAMILSGVFGRHPNLRLGVIEFGASWVPHFMEQLDRTYLAHASRATYKFPAGERPSDHFRRGVFATFQQDPAAMAYREAIGVENLLWGNDYPHAESTYPRSRELLSAHLEGVPLADATAVAGGNCVRLFGFDQESAKESERPAERVAAVGA